MQKTDNRLIKFRAYDKTDKRMIVHEQDFIPVKVTSMGVLRLNPHHENDLWEFMPEDRFVLMQFTGMQDKNGIDIYEGDIITPTKYIKSNSINLKCEVMYHKDMFCLKPNGGLITYKKPLHESLSSAITASNPYEIIGNIYEMPELLTAQNPTL